ncbi:hypothetical protein BDZ94DRAFT_1251037 [Collybia nuda]|uniref:Macro domain-containing protein n=1 Tax=Collybia nuda TaxID=64659 RepID=A0A9P6CHR4_9AGAR|nr:hypothetical protein BDZ94DRAFT_1251037 [Collybia nuda]
MNISISTPPQNPTELVSDAEVPDESMFLPPPRIPTIKDLYNDSTIKPTLPDKIRYQPDSSLLDRISLWQGDITKLKVDSIVNAANKSLLGGGGVDGAIHFAAGRQLVEECRKLNGCATGQAKITRGYNLPSRHVIHTVGPVYSLSDVEEKAQQLASCYKTSLEVAVENDARHIAFPSVSTGIYGYPIVAATRIALGEVRRFCDADADKKLDRVIFVVWKDTDKAVYESLIPEYFPPIPEDEQKSDGLYEPVV